MFSKGSRVKLTTRSQINQSNLNLLRNRLFIGFYGRTTRYEDDSALNLQPPLSNSPSPKDRWVVGIDLGGTTIKLGLFCGREIHSRHEIQTSAFPSPHDAFVAARDFVDQTMASLSLSMDHVVAIGLAMAGVLDLQGASLQETANLKRWHGIDFRNELSQAFAKPVAVLNDANAAALAESVYGMHAGDSLTLLTLGTGIGAGVILDGKPLDGNHHCGGEIGHATIEFGPQVRACGCGRPGHLEAYAGAAGVVQTCRERLDRSNETSSLRSLDDLTPRCITAAASQGDVIALAVIDQTAIYLGRAIAMLAHVVDPPVVLLGGAMNFGGRSTATGDRFLQAICGEVKRLSLTQVGDHLQIDFATLQNDAGVFGASRFALQQAMTDSPARLIRSGPANTV